MTRFFAVCLNKSNRSYFYISALAGGDPKPQQNVRVIPVPHPTNSNYRNRIKEYPHHMRRDHQQFRNNKENKRTQKKKANQKEDKFKLWKEGPNFDTDLRQNVYAQEGQTAVLTCRVYDRGNKTVSKNGIINFKDSKGHSIFTNVKRFDI